MGIRYNIYKYFADKKELNEITQEKLDNLKTIMTRFDIREISFSENYKEGQALKKALNRLSIPTNSDGNKRIVISGGNTTSSGTDYPYTAKEFLSFLDTPDYIVETEIPRIFSTLENENDRFLIVGNGAYTDTLYNYLSANSNITVTRNTDDTFNLDALEPDTFIIFADLRPYQEVRNSAGTQLRTFYLRRLYAPFSKTSEYLLDLNTFILPKLREGGVKVIWIYIPDEKRLTRYSEVQKKLRYWERLRRYTPDLFDRIRARHESNQYLQAELKSIINDNTRGYSTNYHNGQYINFDNGFRRTVGNTSSKTNSVYIYGPCFVRGSSYEDAKTIPSLIKSQIDDRYSVYNMGSTFNTISYIMREKEYKTGDIVVVFSPSTVASSTTTAFDAAIDLTDVYNEISDVENHVFDIAVHFDHVIAEKISEKIADVINELDTSSDAATDPTLVTFGPALKRITSVKSLPDKSLISWLESQKSNIKTGSGRNGAIVMNCNPFTNGHRYLIEQASKQVDNLYIFVVEEDKSEFKFADRIELVKLGTADLGNVTVLSSGKYVISAQTLPGYFDKKNLGKIDLNAQNDLEYFLSIAQYFGISVRFAGEEPIDMFTNQYNVNMKQTLPKYGVEFVEIPRKQTGDMVISASAVRKAMHEGNWELVKELVPPTTYEFLKTMNNSK
ncbi:adenylyltransferase/cytidyltransferase family protein [Butyrivibrio sp. VCB2006]|uniref:adenylyltransferase/cytidyltransferase family protein n=1 Tax=Butyrivibrio sp. VCB2006 TaxID=1280679 RepID=UPI0004022CBF|nr:adenylyltransferase/cytidyltransferase family protein [Butyrivibrio sp. VCB2006]